jgi:4-carboxymuconolactone decarboxylase
MAQQPRRLPDDIHPETLSRLTPIKRENLAEEQRARYDEMTEGPRAGLNLAGLKGPGGVWIRMKKLAGPMGQINRILRAELDLDPRLVEVAILATAREMSSQFEWCMHEPQALQKGVAKETVDIIRHRKPVTGVPEKEAVLIELARESIGAKKTSAKTYARAVAAFGEEQLLNYVALISSYAQTAIVLGILDQQLHDGMEPLLPV